MYIKSYFAALRRAASRGGERALKRAFVEGEKSSRQFCMLSCDRIMEQSKLNQFRNDWGELPLTAAAPESREGNRGRSRGAETHPEHPGTVAWALRAMCRGGQDFPGAAGVAMAMRDPRGINESGAHLGSFGAEKKWGWAGGAGRWRRAGGGAGGAGIPAACPPPPASPAGFAPSRAGCLRCPAWAGRMLSVGRKAS